MERSIKKTFFNVNHVAGQQGLIFTSVIQVSVMPKVGMQPIRRQQLIDATLSAVNELGFGETSISQIAQRAGVSTGIISHYFGGKNGLIEATMRYLLQQ